MEFRTDTAKSHAWGGHRVTLDTTYYCSCAKLSCCQIFFWIYVSRLIELAALDAGHRCFYFSRHKAVQRFIPGQNISNKRLWVGYSDLHRTSLPTHLPHPCQGSATTGEEKAERTCFESRWNRKIEGGTCFVLGLKQGFTIYYSRFTECSVYWHVLPQPARYFWDG